MDLSGIPHHPLFQSVVLPLLLSLIGIGVLRAVSGRDRAAAAIGLAVLAATIWLMGWQTPPTAVMQRLPWIFAGAWLVGIALDAAVASRFLRWSCLGLAWIAASWWLGSSAIPAGCTARSSPSTLVTRTVPDTVCSVTLAVAGSETV